MSTSILISDVLEQAAFRLHLPDFASGEFVTNTQALQLAKMSVSRLGAMLNRVYDGSYFTQIATLSTQAGVDVVSLPTDCKDLVSLIWVANSTRSHVLERSVVTDYQPDARAWSWSYLPKYRLEGNVIVLTPAPTAVETLRCTYTTGLSITATSDTIQALPGCDEWLVLDVCQIIRDREDKDASNFIGQKLKIEEDLKAQAAKRDRHGVTTVRDVTGALDCDPYDWRERGWNPFGF